MLLMSFEVLVPTGYQPGLSKGLDCIPIGQLPEKINHRTTPIKNDKLWVSAKNAFEYCCLVYIFSNEISSLFLEGKGKDR